MSYIRRKSRGDSIDSRSRGNSIDDRSYSFDTNEYSSNVNKTNNNTKAVRINRRKREQTVETILPSPVPDKFKYFIGRCTDNYVGHPAE